MTDLPSHELMKASHVIAEMEMMPLGDGSPILFTGRRIFDHTEWEQSIAGQWFKSMFSDPARFDDKKILIIDFEYIFSGGEYLPILACWTISNQPTWMLDRGEAWCDDPESMALLLAALGTADYIVSYNLFTADILAMKRWGFDIRSNLFKFIDPYQFCFKYISRPGEGNLAAVSILNDGPTPFRLLRKSRSDFAEKCWADVRMLDALFDQMMQGRIDCTNLGTIDVRMAPSDEYQVPCAIQPQITLAAMGELR
jgi:hypothetical protein